MNIFILDENPKEAARLQCDKHIVKMILESAQMLSTAHRMLDGVQEYRKSVSGKRMVKYYAHPSNISEENLYKAVHFDHPCTQWTMETEENYLWHYEHFVALGQEYTYRYGRHHKSIKLKSILFRAPMNIVRGFGLTPFRLAMNEYPECVKESAVDSYRAFYQTKQSRFKMKWTKRDIPGWFESNVEIME
jgi:hypothetical protein